MSAMTPKEIVSELDRFIIGQKDAKRKVAVALRARKQRSMLDPEMQAEVVPKNILMIGPTGVGKTEIARRLASLAKAPFIKVEATKFTEVGYVGRDVDSIIRDLVEISMHMTKEQARERVQQRAHDAAEARILDILLPQAQKATPNLANFGFANEPEKEAQPASDADQSTRKELRRQLRNGEMDEEEIEIKIRKSSASMEILAPPGMEDMTQQLQSMFSNLGGGKAKKKRKVKIKDAFKILQEEEADKLINEDESRQDAVNNIEQNGIVFIDEIDKICLPDDVKGGNVSREGVQRDLLPLIEGSTVTTKYGPIKTDHILFITSGAFHTAKPSDLIPELQGRLPNRVELKALTVEDFVKILTEPTTSLIKQYIALMDTENLNLKFTSGAIKRIAEIAWSVNERVENIGARRLHTVLEQLLEDIAFDAPDNSGTTVNITEKMVNNTLGEVAKDVDLSRYIL